jgi:hypothetical protein
MLANAATHSVRTVDSFQGFKGVEAMELTITPTVDFENECYSTPTSEGHFHLIIGI